MARTDLELAKVEEGEDEVASGGGARELAVGPRGLWRASPKLVGHWPADDGDAFRHCSPSWRRRYGVDPDPFLTVLRVKTLLRLPDERWRRSTSCPPWGHCFGETSSCKDIVDVGDLRSLFDFTRWSRSCFVRVTKLGNNDTLHF
uniref:Uncharacterized protein n=1 Tax=Oryza barthii TaxID=65489 RepID=A0A0D3FSZ3_9ORYZ